MNTLAHNLTSHSNHPHSLVLTVKLICQTVLRRAVLLLEPHLCFPTKVVWCKLVERGSCVLQMSEVSVENGLDSGLTATHSSLGNLRSLNDLARNARANYVIHTGDFGFYDDSSLERIAEKYAVIRL